MRFLLRLHDRLTTLSATASVLCVAVIACSYCYEVVSRYLFNAPTSWASAITVYLLLATVALMAPHVTRTRGHVTITFVLERAGPERARHLAAACIAVSAVVCLLSLWFTATETVRQYEAGTTMMDSLLLTPKWVLSALIAYAFLSSAFYFMRQFPAALKGNVAPPLETDID